MSETTATFLDIVGPLRAEFAIDPVTGDLVGRRPRLLVRLLRGLAVLGCVQGHALVTPAVLGTDAAEGRSPEA
ncbi:hypothetical protein [Modestobacter versicolor]|uniref:Uncharacterized protein n=1 Tax=Modestobacter versicolor TaxID=429133 RepID=A0A839XW45_9ACTN|nr:hypothetical protein [Modestobacter versicolor]MBB3674795.1 hypothetical protein [Modestobacter versicolor]